MDVLQIRKLTNEFGEDFLNKSKYLNNFEELIDYWLGTVVGLPTRRKIRPGQNINGYFSLTDVLFGYYYEADQILCARYTYTSFEKWGHIKSLDRHIDGDFLMRRGDEEFTQSVVAQSAKFTLVFIRRWWEDSAINVYLESNDLKLPPQSGDLLTKIDPKQYAGRVKLLSLGTWEPLPRKVEFYFNLKSHFEEEKQIEHFHVDHYTELYGKVEEDHVRYLSGPGNLRSKGEVQANVKTKMPWDRKTNTGKDQTSSASTEKSQSDSDSK